MDRDLLIDEMNEWLADLGLEEILELNDVDEAELLVLLWTQGLIQKREELGE